MTTGRKLRLETAEVFEPLLEPARYKAAWGGRGSGKSNFFAGAAVERCLLNRPTSVVCIREVQRVLAQSSKKLVDDTIRQFELQGEFEIQADRIKTPGGGLIIFNGMQDHTAESIKSLEGFDIAWVDEAQALSARSLQLLRPTIRRPDSELWFGWNPRRKSDAVDEFFRLKKPDNAIVVEANWRDNPWFPQVLEDERKRDLELYPDRYDHIWEGGYAKAFDGAYFAKGLAIAKRGWESAKCTLPHDGAHTNWATGKRWADHLSDAGFDCEAKPNQGAGAASLEIEAVRRILPCSRSRPKSSWTTRSGSSSSRGSLRSRPTGSRRQAAG
jgi:hypothetical protein